MTSKEVVEDMNYLLVLQWSTTSEEDYDALIELEEKLEAGLPDDDGDVDGHDFGSNEMNIFIQTERPYEAFASAARLLSETPRWASVRAAFRRVDEDEYVGLWPRDIKNFSIA